MKHFLPNIITPNHISYILVNRDLIILSYSPGITQFFDSVDELTIGEDIRNGFPELFGCEEILVAVLDGEQDYFDLKAITRQTFNQENIYFDLYFNKYFDSKNNCNCLIIFLENVTDKMSLEQTLVQATNETQLLVNALEKTRDYTNKIVTSIADALVVTTASGKIKKVNQAACDLFGYLETEILEQKLTYLVDNPQFDLSLHHENLLQKKELILEVVCRCQNGTKIIVAFSCSVAETEIKDSYEFIYVGRNITERKRTQQRLTAQYALAKILSESHDLEIATPKILQAVCESLEWEIGELWMPVFDSESELVNTNSNCLQRVKIWSKPEEKVTEFIEVTGRVTLIAGFGLAGIVWSSGSPKWITDLINNIYFGKQSFAVKVGLNSAFGFPIKEREEVLGVMTFFSSKQQPPDPELLQMMAATGNQIGQFIKRKQAEQKLRESEKRYRDLFENASDLIQSVNAEGKFLYVNNAWRETLGYSDAEIRKMTMFEIVHTDSRQHCLSTFQKIISGENIERVQIALMSKKGEKISLEGSINCKFVDGKPVATRGIFRDITARLQAEEALRQQQQQTETLLLNILPEAIAERLKQNTSTIADSFESVTVLFADLVGFTELASQYPAIEIVEMLNEIFSEFDRLTEQLQLEKIKTIGDAYMVVGGLPIQRPDHAEVVAEMALQMQAAIAQFNLETGKSFKIRIGIHTGSVVAGVIGRKKFIYDLWGDTVNIASRMESHGIPGCIQVTAATRSRLGDRYLLPERGTIPIKGKGEMTTYLLLGKK
ncbi:MAG: PAS domain S-box protein [Kamptonema sp. SIO1D9]|nr:PAS domain S-box protein [Kamptonema sp. SIO1D9]